MKSIVWFRNDLRLRDNPSLIKAIELGEIIPIYIFDRSENDWALGSASKWRLHNSLIKLDQELKKNNLKLFIFEGNAVNIIKELSKKLGINNIFSSKNYEPHEAKLDQEISNYCLQNAISFEQFNSSFLFDLVNIRNSSGGFFKVYTAFWNHCLKNNIEKTNHDFDLLQIKKAKLICDHIDESIQIDELNLLPKINWTSKFSKICGEIEALEQFDDFLRSDIFSYKINRDYPGKKSTTNLSASIHFGEISVRFMWNKCKELLMHSPKNESNNENILCFMKQLVWREFSHYVLYHFPNLANKPFKKEFENISWQFNEGIFDAWKKGKTGIPIIDAAMRELWISGDMHNRCRMIVASFLVKNCLIAWQEGEKWFWDTLLDADLANNAASWQWVAGCGFDASPYYRIFNPVLQSQKFDKDGEYIKKWVPELANLNSNHIHAPWLCEDAILRSAGVVLGENYPSLIVDLDFSRKRALREYKIATNCCSEK